MVVQPLSTDRLDLEPLSVSHAEAVYEALSDDRMHVFVPSDPPGNLSEVVERHRFLESAKSPDGTEHWLNWALRCKKSRTIVGTVQATVPPDAAAMIAYIIFSKHWRQGYAREAATEVIRHVFEDLNAPAIDVYIDTRNVASIGLVESMGFRLRKTIKNADFFKGSSSDEYVYTRSAAQDAPP
jgi:RimJ/RimL family protein N-acetyltransferase